MSTIAYAKQCLSITATSDSETLKRFATGGRFKAILQDNTTVQGYGKYQDEQLKNMGMDIQDTLNRGGDILAVYGDGKLTPISMSSADMQFWKVGNLISGRLPGSSIYHRVSLWMIPTPTIRASRCPMWLSMLRLCSL